MFDITSCCINYLQHTEPDYNKIIIHIGKRHFKKRRKENLIFIHTHTHKRTKELFVFFHFCFSTFIDWKIRSVCVCAQIDTRLEIAWLSSNQFIVGMSKYSRNKNTLNLKI
jgi:hypothetical protein